MNKWWNKRLDMAGCVLFPGDFPPQPQNFSYLEESGIALKPASGNTPNNWSIDLEHSQWGKASLLWNPNLPMPPRELFAYSSLMSDEKDAAAAAGTVLHVRMQARHDHVLRDRKLMLRFLRAVMGQYGVMVMDLVSQNIWSREHLDDELIHDADLDVEAIFTIHSVVDDNGKSSWAHTHGLSEVGAFEFDIIKPSEDVMSSISDLSRSLAFQILEGTLKRSMPEFVLLQPNKTAALVPMAAFLSGTTPDVKKDLSDMVDAFHIKEHSVLCEPAKSSLLGGLFGGGRGGCAPSKLLSRRLPDHPMLNFSAEAGELMAERAARTYPLLRGLREEFADLELFYLAKLGIDADDKSHGKEHMWFELHECGETSVDATLINQPYYVSRLKEGDRGRYPVELITDWTLLTPLGNVTPRSLQAARLVRENRDEVRRAIEEAKRG